MKLLVFLPVRSSGGPEKKDGEGPDHLSKFPFDVNPHRSLSKSHSKPASNWAFFSKKIYDLTINSFRSIQIRV